jgi:hypothetical protein
MSDVYAENGDMNDKREKRDNIKRFIHRSMGFELMRSGFSADELKAIAAEAIDEAREVVETLPRWARVAG